MKILLAPKKVLLLDIEKNNLFLLFPPIGIIKY